MDTRTSTTPPAFVPHQVLSTTSHELRGPLGVARGYLRLLAMTPSLDARATKAVADASRAIDRMAELLDELSDYARWVRGDVTLGTVRTTLRAVLVAAAEAVPLPDAPRVRLEIDAPMDTASNADAARLTRAWSALIGATARSRVEDATIVLALRATDTGHAVLRVVPHDLLDASTEERPPTLERSGAGLSIALADLVIQRHGGQLVERWAGEVWAGYACVLPGS